ncbi:MAG: TetR/AcrR family transcriptional regulator [Burkholderiales bacterium]|nr:TetR/AcrR family transcriptional regulator [Burkholderiales bacterium]
MTNPYTQSGSDAHDTAAARKRALDALKHVANSKPLAEVSYGDIAVEAAMPWQTVKRLLGPRDGLEALLNGDSPEPVDTRDRVLESAARVFARKGYLGASLDEVAADAGLTKGAVYWHFKSKSDLFFALLNSRFEQEVGEHLPAALKQDMQFATPKEGLKALLGNVLQRVREDEDWPRLMLEFMSQARDPEVRARLGTAYREAYRMSGELITHQYTSRGQQPPMDPAKLALFWSALMDGLVLAWLVNPDEIDLSKLVPQFVDMVWSGLGQTAMLDPNHRA